MCSSTVGAEVDAILLPVLLSHLVSLLAVTLAPQVDLTGASSVFTGLFYFDTGFGFRGYCVVSGQGAHVIDSVMALFQFLSVIISSSVLCFRPNQ